MRLHTLLVEKPIALHIRDTIGCMANLDTPRTRTQPDLSEESHKSSIVLVSSICLNIMLSSSALFLLFPSHTI